MLSYGCFCWIGLVVGFFVVGGFGWLISFVPGILLRFSFCVYTRYWFCGFLVAVRCVRVLRQYDPTVNRPLTLQEVGCWVTSLGLICL